MSEEEKEAIEIKLKDIIKIQNLYMDIFNEEDNDYPDYRVIRPKEKAISRTLDKITLYDNRQKEIYDVIIHGTWNNNDNTFKPICDRLRSLGYKIIGGN